MRRTGNWLSRIFQNREAPVLFKIAIEIRRTLSILLIPWVGIIFFCVAASCTIVYYFDLNALIAPVIKAFLLIKAFTLRTFPNWFSYTLWTEKLLSSATASIAVIFSLLSGWKAWSAKKLARQGARLVASQSARFVASSVGVSLLHGRERKSLRGLPGMIRRTLRGTFIGAAMRWWSHTSERNKRLALGLILCLIFAVVGHAVIGISILLFDLIWELMLILFRWLDRLWKYIWPMISRQLPESLLKFVTRRVLPIIANAVPIIRDDHRILYVRFNLKLHYRRFKYSLYRFARSRRPRVRSSISRRVSPEFRKRANAIVDKAADLVEKDDTERQNS